MVPPACRAASRTSSGILYPLSRRPMSACRPASVGLTVNRFHCCWLSISSSCKAEAELAAPRAHSVMMHSRMFIPATG